MKKRFYKLTAVLLAVMITVSMFTALPLNVGAAETVSESISASSGTTGDCTWTLDDNGTLTIGGNGVMGNYDSSNSAPWGTGVTSVIINSGVTSIGDWAFYNCTGLYSVIIPDGVSCVGDHSFYECTGLTYVTFGDGVTDIGNNAFYNCKNLRNITIPDNITSIGSWAFYGCIRFTNVTIPDSVMCIGDFAFRSCAALTSIIVDENNVYYDSRENCNAIIETSSNKLLTGCKNTTIPNSVTSIGDWAFDSCTGLTSVTIPNSVTTISGAAFYGCTGLTSISIPNSVTRVGSSAFYGCTGLASVTIGNGITGIAYATFSRCTGLASITVPDSVTMIDSFAFNDCTGLASINIPDSVTNIGNYAFQNTAWINNQPDGLVYLGNFAYIYKGTMPDNTVIVIENGTKSIVSRAFSGCNGLTSVTIPYSVNSIRFNAFQSCRGLTSVTVEDGVTSIESEAFFNCNKLASVAIPQSVSSIGTRAFGYYYDSNYNSCKINGFTIYGVSGTAAEAYATENGFAFVSIGGGSHSVSDCQITLSPTSYTYDGTAKTPSVTVTDGSKTLSSDTDYTVTYSNNTNVGTATVTVTGKGDYTGSATKNFTINKKSISGATVTLSPTTYTYDGNAKTPSVTVKDGTKTLTADTDYTVAYANNTNVGTATVTVTGKGNYTGTASATFTITSVKQEFVWGQDNWNFINSSPYYFKDSTYRKQISNTYLEALKNNLTNSEYEVIFEGTWYSDAWLDDWWGGSCYGMSSTTLLAKEGLLPYSQYQSGATKLYDLNRPIYNDEVSSLITYYQMLQVKDVIQQQYRTVPKKTNKENIENIISLLDSNSTVLIGFQKEGWGGHAILGIGYEYGSWTYSGVTYRGRIKICDPNHSTSFDKDFNIYFNTKTFNWTIPAYSGMKSTAGAKFNYVGADVSEINEGGWLSGSSGNSISNFVARINATVISDNRSVTKVAKSNGNYVNQSTSPDDIDEDYSFVLGNESQGTAGYNLRDADASYKVSQEYADTLELSIDYENCFMTGGSAAGESVIFDKSGYVTVNGESASYNLSMTFDNNYPTDWFSVRATGINADTASLQKVSNGYVLSADNLEDVIIKVNNRESSAVAAFSTDYTTVLIYEINEETIGLKADVDNNGTFDLDIDYFTRGDADKNGTINVNDVTAIQKHIAKLDVIPEEWKVFIDTNSDGVINIIDATALQKKIAGLS